VVAGNLVPDHSTIAEFAVGTSARWARSSPVCSGCVRERGWRGVVAIDGTKMSANASMNANRDFG
jgi:hypothetical protein